MIQLREQSWEGLPPPPVFTTNRSEQAGTGQEGPIATPVTTSLGLPNIDTEPQAPLSPPLEPVIAPETETTPPATQSPSISIASLSDFTIADASDDELPTDVEFVVCGRLSSG